MGEFDLSRGLRDLSRTPHVDGAPVAVERVTTRVHRARALRATGLTAACVAAAVGLAGAVWAVAPWDEGPVPPAIPEPSVMPDPSQDPTPETRREPTREPDPVVTDPPAPPEPDPPVLPLVAVTTAGDLVVLDPATGAVERTVEDVVPAFDDGEHSATTNVSPSPDGRTVWVDRRGRDAEGRSRSELRRVDLEDGTVEQVAEDAHSPSVSPDGTTVAYHSVSPDGELTEYAADDVWGITILDVETSTTRFLPHRQSHQETLERAIDWSRDGTQLFVSTDDLVGNGPRVLDVTAGTVDEAAQLVENDGCHWSGPGVLADGRLLVGCTKDIFRTYFEQSRLRVLDAATGELLDEVSTGGREVTSIAAGPETDGAHVVLRDYDNTTGSPLGWALYRWSDDGGLEHVADDVVAVGW